MTSKNGKEVKDKLKETIKEIRLIEEGKHLSQSCWGNKDIRNESKKEKDLEWVEERENWY